MATKRELVIDLINSNPNLSRKDYIKMICEQVGMSTAGASTYYYFAVDSGKLNFQVQKREKTEQEKEVPITVTEPSHVKVKSPNIVKAVTASLEDKPKITDMTVEEISDKATKRSKKKKVTAVQTTEGVDNFDPVEAKAYVDAVTDDISNFETPDHLTHEEVQALI